MLVVVKVAELRYGEAIESSRQAGERDFHRYQSGAVRLKNYGVFAQDQSAGGGNSGRKLKKPPSSWNCQSKSVSSCAVADTKKFLRKTPARTSPFRL